MSHKKEIKRIDLATIKSPEFLKDLSYNELSLLSQDIRTYIIDSVSKNGGHLAANLGVVEATIALCRSFNFSKDKLIFDVGHQSYTYKILTGRSLERLRKSDGVSGFQKMSESPYDHFECGHSSTSISAAKGMAIARDLSKENYDIVAFIGDASITNGLALEGLNNLANGNNKVIVVLNDNDMSITKPVGGLAKSFRNLSNSSLYRRSKHRYQKVMKATKFGRWILGWTGAIKNWIKRHVMAINLFDNIGLAYIGPVDGHDIKKIENALDKAKKLDKSCVVHLKTIKGKGYKYAENDDSGVWHGVGPFNKETGEIYKDPQTITWSEVYSKAILNHMNEDQDAVLVVAATGVGSHLNSLFELCPSRTYDVGIAEEHALTMAGGLSASGKHPIISMYSTFLQRAFDELSHDIARMNLNATLLIDRSGLVGEDGNTHQGLYDESFLISTPNTVVAMASNDAEARSLLKESFNNHGLFCIRYPRARIVPSFDEVETAFGKWKKELDGDVAVVSVGPITQELKKAILDSGKKAALYNALYQKPLDTDLINKELIKYSTIIIYDAYAVETGFANYLSSYLLSLGYQGKVIIKAVPVIFVEHASQKEQLAKYGLDVDSIVKLL